MLGKRPKAVFPTVEVRTDRTMLHNTSQGMVLPDRERSHIIFGIIFNAFAIA